MEPEKFLQELRYSDSDKRKKLDGLTLMGINGGAKDVKDAYTGQGDQESLDSKPKYDLRKSLAWDSAFFTSPGFLDPEELLQTLNSGHSQNGRDLLGHEEHQLWSAKYMQREIESATEECNLRKSLAWDSAFFTSEGVLNPEELSLVNKGFKKSGIHILPGIEELCMTSESNCNIDSDGSSLASLEVELFEDIRTSMHQLSKASSTVGSSSRQERYRDMQKVNWSKKMDRVPNLKVNSRPTSIIQTVNGNQPERATKESSTPQLRQFYARSGESDPSLPLKPAKILGRVRVIPMAQNRRVSLVANEVNGESKIVQATNGKSLTVKPNPRKTCSDNPSSTRSLEFSLLSPPSSMNESEVSSSPCSQFSTCKSSLKSSATKTDPLNVNSPCNSTLTPQSEYKKTNQVTPENCCQPTYSSVKKNSPFISPSVSTGSCSSRSSTSTDHGCHDSITSADESCRQFSIDSDALAQSDLEIQQQGETNVAQDGKGSMCPNPCIELKGRNYVSFDATRNIKPSGLRMPSPKIGFFDVDDSLVPVETGGSKSHSGVQNAVSKVGACNRNLNGYGNRSRPGKIQTSQPLKDIKSTKICPQQTRRFPISGTMKSTFGLAPVSIARSELHCEEKRKDCLRNEKMARVREHGQEFGVESRAKMIREREEQSCLRGNTLLQKEHIKAKTIYTGNDPHMLQENEKENLFVFQNELECLHAQVTTLDVGGDVVIDFKEKNGPSEG